MMVPPMLRRMLRRARGSLAARTPLSVEWARRDPGSWIAANIPTPRFRPPAPPQARLIERIAAETEALGRRALWDGYRSAYTQDNSMPWADREMARSSEEVRSQPRMGRFFAWLATARGAEIVVEVGTAFGISGMYWAAGLEQAGRGLLLTFDPNETWHLIAKGNIARISPRAVAVPTTVEDGLDAALAGRQVDIAFIDAIHTGAFVRSQVDLLLPGMKPGGLLLVDDITFSGDMRKCWSDLAMDERFCAALTLDSRVGLLELPG